MAGNRSLQRQGRLSGKTALLTGCATGLGIACAEAAVREGANVLLADINIQAANELALRLGGSEGGIAAIECDIGDPESIAATVAAASDRFRGSLDILFNNAAATKVAAHQDLPIARMDIGIWDLTMRINLRGTMLMIRDCLPLMRSGASIINTSSNSGRSGNLDHSAYAVSKAAIIALTREVATQHGRDGIRCNAIAPGLIISDLVKSNWDPAARRAMNDHELSPRNGEPGDIATAFLWLASEESGFVNAQCICVDGGSLSHQPFFADRIRPGERT